MITINKEILADNGVVVSYHKITGVEVMPDGQSLKVLGSSWPNQVLAASNEEPAARFCIVVSLAAIGHASLVDSIATSLTTTGPLASGTVIPQNLAPLEEARALQWAHIKDQRALAISQNMMTPYGEIQCKEEDRRNISDSVLLAQILTAAGQPVLIDWTLADNTVVSLDAVALQNIGLLLGARVQAAHATARVLRSQIDQSLTPEEVKTVQWPLAE